MRHPSKTVDQRIAAIAFAAHGVVTRQELLAGGVTVAEIRHRLDTGALIREYPGVYRAGHRAPGLEARYMAAVKACGIGAALSGMAAAFLFALVRGDEPAPEVTCLTQRRLPGVITHQSRRIDRRDTTAWNGVPVTTVPRTLVDIAARLPEDELARAVHAASGRFGTTPDRLEAVLTRRPTSPGAAKLRRVLRGEARVVLSRLEARFLSLLGEAGLPLPDTNRPAGMHRVDCRWPDHRLTVELDSYRYHSSRHAWEQDRRREREAYARGDEFRRFTHGDVFVASTPMLAELRALLAE